jgi:hypothetical protein
MNSSAEIGPRSVLNSPGATNVGLGEGSWASPARACNSSPPVASNSVSSSLEQSLAFLIFIAAFAFHGTVIGPGGQARTWRLPLPELFFVALHVVSMQLKRGTACFKKGGSCASQTESSLRI